MDLNVTAPGLRPGPGRASRRRVDAVPASAFRQWTPTSLPPVYYSEDVKSRTNKLFQGSNEAADAVKLKFQELDESADKALTTMKSAEVRVHSIETRSAAVDRELKDAEQRFIALLARFQTPMAVAAFAGGVVGACVAALMAVIVWSLLGSTAGG